MFFIRNKFAKCKLIFFPKIQVFVKQGNGGTYWPVTTVCVCFYDDLCSSANRSIFFFKQFLLSQQISSPACSVKLSVSLNKKKEQKIDEKMINKRQNICFLIKKILLHFLLFKKSHRGDLRITTTKSYDIKVTWPPNRHLYLGQRSRDTVPPIVEPVQLQTF